VPPSLWTFDTSWTLITSTSRRDVDAQVMEVLPPPLNRERGDRLAKRAEADVDRTGYGRRTLEVRESGDFIGIAALAPYASVAYCTPATEVWWNPAPDAWGKGYASEAARAALDLAFHEIGRRGVGSWAAVIGPHSRGVMERPAMTHGQSDELSQSDLSEGLGGHRTFCIDARSAVRRRNRHRREEDRHPRRGAQVTRAACERR